MNSIVNIFVLLGFAACCALTSLAQPLEAQSLAPAGDTKLRQTHSPTAVSPKLFSNSKKSKLYLSNFSIKKIRFTGNNLLSNKRLEKLTEPYLNKPIDATQLDYLRSNIRSVYRDMGGFARIVFERRGIDDSELSINIEELVFKSSQFSGNSFLSNEQVEALIEPYLNSAFDFKNIKILKAEIEAAYQALGGNAQVVIQPQDINAGRLIIRIEELIVKAITFTGNSLLLDSHIQGLIEPYLNRPFDFNQLEVLSTEIEAAYQNAQAVARVVIPPQEINDGMLRLQIEESVFGIVRSQGSTARVGLQQVTDIIGSSQDRDQRLAMLRLDRGVLLANDLPGVSVRGILVKGTAPLATDIIAIVTDEQRVVGRVQSDNTGATAIGAYRILGSVEINSPLGRGDLLSATYLHSEGSDYGYLNYSLPLGSNGLRAGVSGSRVSYDVISSEFAALGASGSAYTAGLRGNYPVIRSRSANLVVSAAADYSQFSNRDKQQGLVSDYSSMNYSASLYWNAFDRVGTSGITKASMTITAGKVDLTDSPNQSLVAAANNAQGRFSKIVYSASRSQFIADGLSLTGSISGQVTNANLDSSEMFYLGGAYDVQVYGNPGAGSQGQIANVELRKVFSEKISGAMFYDYGHVRVNVDNDFTGASSNNRYSMSGAGLALFWTPRQKVDVKLIWAKRLDPDTNTIGSALSNTRDRARDSTLGGNQLWLVLSAAF
jgi:hemolysin activation/secretion protein